MSESIWDDPRITAYVLGEMSDQERHDFEIEMEADGELASAVEEARTVTDQLASLYGDETIPSLGDERRAAIVAGGAVSPAVDPSPSWPRIGLVLAIAAALLLMLGVAPVMYRQHQAEKQVTMAQLEDELELAQASSESTSREALRQSGRKSDLKVMAEELVDAELALEEMVPTTESLSITSRPLGEKRSEDLARVSNEQAQRGGESLSQRGSMRRSIVPANTGPASEASGPDGSEIAGRPTVRYQSSASAPAPAAAPLAAPAAVDGLGASVVKAKDSGLSSLADSDGETNVEFVPESGTIVLSGREEMKERVVEAIERQADNEALRTRLSASADQRLQESGLQDSQGTIVTRAAQPAVAVTELASGLSYRAKAGAVNSSGKLPELEELQLKTEGFDYGLPIDEGRGPGVAGDRFEPITDNPFQRVADHPLSTFSVDVDTASYSKVRDYLMRANQLPRPDAVRIEELVNYFSYDYQPPADTDEHPFAARVSVTSCPWNEGHRLARIALKGKTMEKEDRPQCNLVFLLDTSGSMNAPNKLPLVIEGMQLLLKQLNENDKVAITVYAGSAGLVLDSTAAKKEKKIRKALTQLSAGGSTNGGAGIALAYQTARDHFIPEGVNRVILCTDGDFNVGTTGTDELVRMVENEAKGGVFLSVLGFGMGNHNDAMLEQISGRGNGNYAFIDSREEAHKVLVEQTSGTLVTIAKDVKLQIEFNPTQVSSYRLIGYENRILAKEDFNDDKKDAGEIGAGHSVTALYEIVPAGVEADAEPPKVDDLKYQQPSQPSEAADSEEMLTLKLRYKQPDGDTSTLVEFPVVDEGGQFADADDDVRFVAAVASFGMQLRRSPYAGSWTMSDAMNIANRAKGEDRDGLRAEFVTLVQKASELMGEE